MSENYYFLLLLINPGIKVNTIKTPIWMFLCRINILAKIIFLFKNLIPYEKSYQQ